MFGVKVALKKVSDLRGVLCKRLLVYKLFGVICKRCLVQEVSGVKGAWCKRGRA